MRLGLAISVLAAGCAYAGNQSPAGTNDAKPSGDIDAPSGHPIDSPQQHPIDAPMHVDDAAPDAKVFLDAAPCVPSQSQLLGNPGWDSGATTWIQQPIPNTASIGGPFDPIYMPSDPTTELFPQAGAWEVWLGGLSGGDLSPPVATVTDAVYQDVFVPVGTTALSLTGYYVIGTVDTSASAVDTMTLALRHTDNSMIETAESFSNLNAGSDSTWKAFSYNFSAANAMAVAGTTVRLHLTSTNNASNQTNFFFDSFALTATHCP